MRIAARLVTRALRGSIRPHAASRILRVALAALWVLAAFSSTASATDFTVTKTADTNDTVCSALDCSLREAIGAANANIGADRVILGSSQTYALTLGRLTVTDALTLDGNASTINGGGLDRVLDVLGAFAFTINSVTITGGTASGFLSLGGGLNIRGATVILNSSTVTNNSTALESSARDDGGGIAVVGSYNAAAGTTALASLTLNNSTVSNNTGASGGGIVCVLCALTISTSAISGNTAIAGDGGGGVVLGNSSTVAITGSALVSNTVSGGAARGGGWSAPFGTSTTTLGRDRIVSNTGALGSAIFNNAGAIAAVNNWWGCNFGPGVGGAGCAATPNGVSGTVTTAPFLVLKAAASAATVTPGGSSAITADLTLNSSNADTSAGGTVPNGTIATFSGTLGTFATPTSPTTNGKATDLFTAGGAFGTAGLTLIVDGQLVSLSLPITGCQTITLSATTFPNGTAGVAYPATTLTQTGGFGVTTFAVAGGALPNGLGMSSAGTVSGNPTQTGFFTFLAMAIDGNGCSGSRSYGLTIVAGSQLSMSSIGNTTTRRTAPVTVSFVVSNLGGGTIAASSSNTPLVPNGNLAVGGSGANRTLTITALPGQIGTTTITVTASAGGSTASSSFVLLVYSSTPGDFDGDGKSDITVFRPSNGTWYTVNSTTGLPSGFVWGSGSDRPVPADYDGDGKTDIAIFRPSDGGWFIVRSSTGIPVGTVWGTAADVTVPGDYDGDGKTDLAVFRPSDGTWQVVRSTTGVPFSFGWGSGTDIPVPGDYDGDGKTDFAVFRPSSGTWFVMPSSTGVPYGFMWGSGADKPVAADYDGDGRADISIFRPSEGAWYISRSSTGVPVGIVWGNGADTPVPGDFDGDSKTDLAVFRPSTGTWYVTPTATGVPYGFVWGNSADIPVLKRP